MQWLLELMQVREQVKAQRMVQEGLVDPATIDLALRDGQLVFRRADRGHCRLPRVAERLLAPLHPLL